MAINSMNNIKRFVFVIGLQYVSCEAENQYLCVLQVNAALQI